MPTLDTSKNPACCKEPMAEESALWRCLKCGLVLQKGMERLAAAKRQHHRLATRKKKAAIPAGRKQTVAEYLAAGGKITRLPPARPAELRPDATAAPKNSLTATIGEIVTTHAS